MLATPVRTSKETQNPEDKRVRVTKIAQPNGLAEERQAEDALRKDTNVQKSLRKANSTPNLEGSKHGKNQQKKLRIKVLVGRWTFRLIPNIQQWVKRWHGEVDYLMGTAIFRPVVLEDAKHSFWKRQYALSFIGGLGLPSDAGGSGQLDCHNSSCAFAAPRRLILTKTRSRPNKSLDI
ncbi:hypothetical protein J6590_100268 [Homalodisca vitripennis]|nr:hypothetical protein J6590_100268 [Homalodisca vitripennis]